MQESIQSGGVAGSPRVLLDRFTDLDVMDTTNYYFRQLVDKSGLDKVQQCSNGFVHLMLFSRFEGCEIYC